MYIEQTSPKEYAINGNLTEIENIFEGLIYSYNMEPDGTERKEIIRKQAIAIQNIIPTIEF